MVLGFFKYVVAAMAVGMICVTAVAIVHSIFANIERHCFKMVNMSNQANSPVLLDECSGNSWLLVRVLTTDKGDEFTYEWHALNKRDYHNPHLSYGNGSEK